MGSEKQYSYKKVKSVLRKSRSRVVIFVLESKGLVY